MDNLIGIMQGRLSPSIDGRLQFFPFKTWGEEFKIAKRLGFDAIEWLFSSEDFKKNPILTTQGIKKIKELTKKHGIKTPSICGEYFIDFPFVGKSAEKSLELLNRLIKQSIKIGAERILLPFLGNSDIKSERQKKEIIVNLKSCLKTAETHNVELSLETSLPADELKMFVKKFNSSPISVYYDIGNCTTFFGKNVPNEIKSLGKLIGGVHIKDRKFGSTVSYSLGTGETDFSGIFRVLKKINYKRPFILETARDSHIADSALCHKYLEFVKKHLKEV